MFLRGRAGALSEETTEAENHFIASDRKYGETALQGDTVWEFRLH